MPTDFTFFSLLLLATLVAVSLGGLCHALAWWYRTNPVRMQALTGWATYCLAAAVFMLVVFLIAG